MRKLLLIFSLCWAFTSCTKLSNPLLTPEEEKIWLSDKNGCSKKRSTLIKKVQDNKALLKGYSEDEIVKFLGQPDEQELYNRGQKFFRYYLVPGPSCNMPDAPAQALQIRFSALNRSNEIVVIFK